MLSPTNYSEFIYQPNGFFKNGKKKWSLQQILQTNIPFVDNSQNIKPRYRNPSQNGGTLFMASNNNTIEVLSNYHNGSCLLLWLSDHFGDSWDSLVLTVRAPDTTNNSFSPKCDQIDPFLIRYCPYKPSDEGVYIIKPYAATTSRFFWEISWKVQVESTGQIYQGDADSKMMFNFNSTTLSFNFIEILNERKFIVNSISGLREVEPCFRCAAITTASWAKLQDIGDTSLWPFVAIGAPYYISDVSGRLLYFSGRVCDGVYKYECYQILPNGQYIMRMGGGLFGKILNFPLLDAHWYGCGASGTWRDQFIFQIANQTCYPMQVFRYNTTCDKPPLLLNGLPDAAFGSTTNRTNSTNTGNSDSNNFHHNRRKLLDDTSITTSITKEIQLNENELFY